MATLKKETDLFLKSLKKKEIDFIYISHLHTDHFDRKFLIDLKKSKKISN